MYVCKDALEGTLGRCNLATIKPFYLKHWTAVGSPHRPCQNITSAVSPRQKIAKKRSLRAVNEDFERTFNVVMAKRSSSYTVPARGAQGTVIGPKS